MESNKVFFRGSPGLFRGWRTTYSYKAGWFQILFIFTPTWGNGSMWLILFKWVETTNYYRYCRDYNEPWQGSLNQSTHIERSAPLFGVTLDIQAHLLRFGMTGPQKYTIQTPFTSGGMTGCLGSWFEMFFLFSIFSCLSFLLVVLVAFKALAIFLDNVFGV